MANRGLLSFTQNSLTLKRKVSKHEVKLFLLFEHFKCLKLNRP